jgi:hypothetical protein
MTVIEQHEAVRLGLDKTSSLTLPAFETEELNYWLNEAQLELIKQKMFGNNYRGEDFDMGSKRADDLSNLMTLTAGLTYNVAGTSPEFRPHAYHPNVAVVDIVETNMPKYLYYIGTDLIISDPYAPSTGVVMETELIEQKLVGKLIETPYNKPFLKNGYVYLKEDQVNVIYDPESTPTSVYVTYLRKPKILIDVIGAEDPNDYTTTCELVEQVHPEIVALTVKLLLENIESPRVQSNEFELSKKE